MPATHLLVAAWSLLGGPPATASPAAQEMPRDVRFRESVTVESVVVDARVVDGSGRPVLGLGPGDFRLRVDGHEVPLQSATWVAGGEPPPVEATEAAIAAGAPVERPGRLVVYLFQKDMEPSRIVGLMRMLQRARSFADGLAPEDRVAVASFDSHLKLWLDFTTDRDRLHRILERSILFERHPVLNVSDPPSLAASFDSVQGRRAATLETALLLVAQALRDVPGPKSLVLFGWGMGRWTPGVGVLLDDDYGPARRALADARVTVFALDVTDADFHTLEVGLEQVAEDTGGFYAKTHVFDGQAMRRLGDALAGHYVLTFAPPALPRAEHALDIRLVGRKGTVLARRSYEG